MLQNSGVKATTENRFAKPISEVQIQTKIGDTNPLNRQNIKKNGLLICSRTGDSKEMRKWVILAVLKILHNSLEVMSDEELNRSLALFVCEVRKANGSKYPLNTFHGMVASIKHYLKGKKRIVRLFNVDKFSFLRIL